MNAVKTSSSLESYVRVSATTGVFALTALRAILAPCMVILAMRQAPGWAFITCLTIVSLRQECVT